MYSEPIAGLDKSERDWSMFCHLAAFAGYVFPFGHVLGPLILWLLRREESEFVDFHGRQVLSFQITMTIYVVVAGLLCLILIGFVLRPLVLVFDVVATILAAVRAQEGRTWSYPMAIPFLRSPDPRRP